MEQSQVDSAQPKRRRKGISVSLTPDKKGPQVPNRASPRNEPIRLEQSFVQIVEPPVYQKFVRVFPVMRSVDTPVRFTYSNVSKEQEIKEAEALNQELYVLKKQIQDKKQVVESLSQKHNPQMVVSNVRTDCRIPEPRYVGNFLQPSFPMQIDSSVSQTIIQENQNPRRFQEKNVTKEKASTDRSALQFIQKNDETKMSYIRQESAEKRPIHPIINTFPIEQKRKEIKKEFIAEPMPIKKQNKENKKERLQRLRWAQQKLLDIIKVCENGL